MVAPSAVVNTPAFVIVIVAAVLVAPFRFRIAPLKSKALVVAVAPVNVVDVVPSVCVNASAANVLSNATIAASRIVSVPVPRSTAPVSVMLPNSPASIVRFGLFVSVSVPVMTRSSPAASPVCIVSASVLVSVTFVANANPSFVLVRSSPMTLLPAPF